MSTRRSAKVYAVAVIIVLLLTLALTQVTLRRSDLQLLPDPSFTATPPRPLNPGR